MLYSFLGSLFITLLLTPVVGRMAGWFGIVDLPSARKIHSGAVPRLGGLAIVCGVVVGLLIASATGAIERSALISLVIITATSVAIFLVGLADDLLNVPSKLKLLSLVLASMVVCACGLRINNLIIAGLFTIKLGALSWPVTVLWIVGIAVAMNFIDGLDGLAGGIAAITAAACSLLAISSGNIVAAIFALSLLGSTCGFLCFNFHPARIFMGDSGSMFLGFALAVCALSLQSSAVPGALLLPAMALAVPLLDLILTMLRRRVLQRRSLFAAERGHIHHRLLDAGLSQKQCALLLYGVTAATAAGGFLALAGRFWALLSMGLVTTFIVLFFHRSGAARLGDIVCAFRRNRSSARDMLGHQRSFEDLQLRLAMARTFEGWWSETCAAAHALGFASLVLHIAGREGAPRTMRWDSTSAEGQKRIELTFPIPPAAVDHHARITLCAAAGHSSLEAVSHRIALFTRLMDEFTLSGLTPTPAIEIRPRFEHEVDLRPPPRDVVDAAIFAGA